MLLRSPRVRPVLPSVQSNVSSINSSLISFPLDIVKPEKGNPSPSQYDLHNDYFKNDMDQGKGSSFGLGRKQMQLVDHDRDIKYLKDNPSPHKYAPVHVGKVLAKDGV